MNVFVLYVMTKFILKKKIYVSLHKSLAKRVRSRSSQIAESHGGPQCGQSIEVHKLVKALEAHKLVNQVKCLIGGLISLPTKQSLGGYKKNLCEFYGWGLYFGITFC